MTFLKQISRFKIHPRKTKLSQSLRLGFHYHTPAYASEGGAIKLPGYLGCFLDSISERCTSVTCFLHEIDIKNLDQMDYQVRSKNLSLVSLGGKGNVPKRMIFANAIASPVRENRVDLDLMMVRGPTPLLPAVVRAAGNLPTALLLVGDYVTGIDDLPQPGWRKELIRLWAEWNKREQTKAAQHSLTFVNSHKLYEELRPQVPDLVETRTTTLTASDFYEREDTCDQSPYHLLYTGRLDRGKRAGGYGSGTRFVD